MVDEVGMVGITTVQYNIVGGETVALWGICPSSSTSGSFLPSFFSSLLAVILAISLSLHLSQEKNEGIITKNVVWTGSCYYVFLGTCSDYHSTTITIYAS